MFDSEKLFCFFGDIAWNSDLNEESLFCFAVHYLFLRWKLYSYDVIDDRDKTSYLKSTSADAEDKWR